MSTSRFPHARLAIGRLFTLLAIVTLPRDQLVALNMLFDANDEIKAAQSTLKALEAREP